MITKTIKLNTRAAISWLDRLALPPALIVALLVLVVAAGISTLNRIRIEQAAAAVPTPALAPIIIVATQPAIVPPTAVPMVQVAAVLPRFVVCYDQPVGGAVLGPIPAPDASAIVARYGSTWVMTPWNGGYCWLHAEDVGLPDVADLAPAPAPQVIYVASDAAPAPTSAPLVGATPVWATAPAAARPEDFTQPDPKARCQFIGCLPGR